MDDHRNQISGEGAFGMVDMEVELSDDDYSKDIADEVNLDAPDAYTGLSISRDEDLDGRFLRLLRLKPGDHNDGLKCDLVRRPIYDAGKYTAVSYAWTHQSASDALVVGKRADLLPITAHLAAALRRLRSTHSLVSVWVDAVCINQNDPEDRACQVEIMHEIFGGAAEVRIWLGEDQKLTGDYHSDTMVLCRLCRSRTPWWTRLWVLQECAYARKCPKVMLGGQLLDMEHFLRLWKNCIVYAGELEAVSLLRYHLALAQPLYDAWQEQEQTGRHRTSLLSRLRETANRQCSVPHDRVYALLNLVNEEEAALFSPDYLMSIERLSRHVTCHILGSPEWRLSDFQLFSKDLKPNEEGTLDEAPMVYDIIQPIPTVVSHSGSSTLATTDAVPTAEDMELLNRLN